MSLNIVVGSPSLSLYCAIGESLSLSFDYFHTTQVDSILELVADHHPQLVILDEQLGNEIWEYAPTISSKYNVKILLDKWPAAQSIDRNLHLIMKSDLRLKNGWGKNAIADALRFKCWLTHQVTKSFWVVRDTLIATALDRAGNSVITFSSPITLFKALQENIASPDFVVLDMKPLPQELEKLGSLRQRFFLVKYNPEQIGPVIWRQRRLTMTVNPRANIDLIAAYLHDLKPLRDFQP